MATQTGSIDLTASNSVKLAAEAGWQSDLDSYYTKSEIDVTVSGINSTVSTKVGEDEVISSINQSSESVSINANKINLQGAVTISDLSSDAQSATLNSNISVGGRNLLTGTGDWSDISTSTTNSGTVSGDTFTFSVHESLTWYGVNISYPHLPFDNVDGKTLTLSFDYRSDDFSDTTGNHYIYINAAASATINGDRSKYRQISTSAFDGVYVPTTEWQRGSITFDLSEALFNAGSGECNYFYIQFYNHTLNSLQLRHVKLEVGNVATDWSQAQEDLEAYADESAYLSAKPNLAPIGSAEFSDVYNATTNPDGYWRSTLSEWFAQLDDGWIHVYRDNSSGTSAANSTFFRPSPSPTVVAGEVYTILTEIRNNASTGTGTNDFYLQQINNNQFWGNTSGVVIDDDHVTTTTTVSLLTCGQSYVLRSYRIADTAHLTAGTPSPEMFRYNFRVAAGSVLNFDFRMSVYEGIYDGPYKPYAGTQLFATQTDASDAAKTATSYVTDIDSNGITVHPSRSDYATNGGRAVINADGLTVYLGSDDVASYGASARIGKSNSDRVTVDSTNGITIYKGNSKRLQTTANGIDVYGSDGTTSIASFGATARIGKSNGTRVTIDTSEVKIIPSNKTSNALTFTATDDYAYIGYGNNYLGIGGDVELGYDCALGVLGDLWVSSGGSLNVGSSAASGSPKFSVGSNGYVWTASRVEANYQLIAHDDTTSTDVALRANTAGNRGVYDVTNDKWMLFRNYTNNELYLGGSVDPLHHYTNTCTVNSTNATIYNSVNYCWHNNAVCTVYLSVNLKSSLANASTVDVATAPENYRPPYAVMGSVYVTGQNVNLQAEILGAGTIRVNNRSGSAVTTSANIYMSFTFAL